MRISGNTVLITGGTSGIGLEMADQLIGLGNTVLVTGRSLARLKAAKQRLPQLRIFKSDAGDPKAIRGLAQVLTRRFPALNVVVNNAGVMRKIDLQGSAGARDGLCDEIEINLNGPLRMVQAFLPHLKKQPAAAIVCKQTALLGAFDPRDMEGVPAMPVADLVRQALAGMARDRLEICPGSSNALKFDEPHRPRLYPGPDEQVRGSLVGPRGLTPGWVGRSDRWSKKKTAQPFGRAVFFGADGFSRPLPR